MSVGVVFYFGFCDIINKYVFGIDFIGDVRCLGDYKDKNSFFCWEVWNRIEKKWVGGIVFVV